MFFHLNFFHEWNPRINNSKNKTKALDCFTVTIDCKIDTDYWTRPLFQLEIYFV